MAETQLYWVILILVGINVHLNDARKLNNLNFYDADVQFKVTLHIYSGVPNPTWTIDNNNALYGEVNFGLNSKQPTDLDKELGYRGWTVIADNTFGQKIFTTVGCNTDVDLENLLLNTAEVGDCDDELRRFVLGNINSNTANNVVNNINNVNTNNASDVELPELPEVVDPTDVNGNNRNNGHNGNNGYVNENNGRKKRQARNVCSTRFQPRRWNYYPVQRYNNCYNYATDRITYTFAQPGRGSGDKFGQLEASSVRRATVRDGYRRLNGLFGWRCRPVALVIWPGRDYHFYRMDNEGAVTANGIRYWSHKPGSTRATDTDNSNNYITDPRNADRGPYTVFAGFLDMRGSVTIR